jgi:Cu/Ag efflux protein CusF
MGDLFQAANATTAPADQPSESLINYAGNLGIDEGQLSNIYSHLKQNNPGIADAQIASALKVYASLPQNQLNTAMQKEQQVQNALPTSDQIKNVNDPSVGQKYADFQKANQGNQILSGNTAAQSDLFRQQAGGSPTAVNQNNDYWKQQADNVTRPQEIAAAAQKNQMAGLGDLRTQLQQGIENLKGNVNAQVQFESMDASSQLSKNLAQQLVAASHGAVPADIVGKLNVPQMQMLFQDKDKAVLSSFQEMVNNATKAHADLLTANAANTTANTGRQKQNFNEGLVKNNPQDYDVSGGEPSTSEGKKATEKTDADTYTTAAKANVPAQNALNVVNQAILTAKKAYTGPGGAILAHLPNTKQQELEGYMSGVFLNRMSGLTASGLSAGAERLEALQNAVKAAAGNTSQGQKVLLESLSRVKDEIQNSQRDNQARVKYYEKNRNFTGYTDVAPQPTYSSVAKGKGGFTVNDAAPASNSAPTAPGKVLKYNPETGGFE